MLVSGLLLLGVLAAIAPSIGGQVDELGTGVENGVREIGVVLADEPFNLSQREINQRIDEGIDRLRENSGPLSHGLQTRRDPARRDRHRADPDHPADLLLPQGRAW